MLCRLRRSNQSWRSYPSFLIEENRWRAQRYGVGDPLFDFGKGELVPFASLIDELLDLIPEDAAVLGCEARCGARLNIATGGTSADRQVACYEKLLADGASSDEALIGVVDQLIAETVAGTYGLHRRTLPLFRHPGEGRDPRKSPHSLHQWQSNSAEPSSPTSAKEFVDAGVDPALQRDDVGETAVRNN